IAPYLMKVRGRLARGERLVDGGQCFLALPLRRQCSGTEIGRPCIRRFLGRDGRRLSEDIVPGLDPDVRSTEVGVRLEVVGLQTRGAAKLAYGIQMPGLGRVRAAKEVQGGRELRVRLESILELDDGFVVLALRVIAPGLVEIPLLDDRRVLRA